MEQKNIICEKRKDTGRVKEKDGSVHICFDCLRNGRLDQHDVKLKSASELGIKL